MAVSSMYYVKPRPAQVGYSWITWLVLSILLVGPLVGPFFSWLGWPILGLINWPIYLMGENACPQPALVFHVLGYPLVVCSRCWSGVFGLWIVLLSYRAASAGPFWRAWMRLPELARIGLALLAFSPWVIDIVAYDHGWWQSGDPFLMLSGALGGLGAGALLLPLAAKDRSRNTPKARGAAAPSPARAGLGTGDN